MRRQLNQWLPTLVLLATLAGSSLPALAETQQGKIDFLSLKNMNIVVDDHSLTLATGYVVKNKAGKIISAFNLKKGKRIEYLTDSSGRVIELIMK